MNDQTMTDSAPETSSEDNAPPLYISAVLKRLDPKHRPTPSPACETCPLAVWFTTKELLKCFCRQMHLIVWDAEEPPILTCDGRELAILQLQAEQNG